MDKLHPHIQYGTLVIKNKLRIDGKTYVYDDMDVDANIDAWGMTINGVPVATSNDTYWSSAGGGKIYYNSGNVGINDIDPSERLSVGGNIAVTGTVDGYDISASGPNWDTAYTERHQWDGGSTNLVPATGRASLELGSIATQDANSVNITGGTVSGITSLSVNGNVDMTGNLTVDGGEINTTTGNIKLSPASNVEMTTPLILGTGTLSAVRQIAYDNTDNQIHFHDGTEEKILGVKTSTVLGSTDISTTSTNFVDMTDMSIDITTRNSPVLILASFCGYPSGGAASIVLRLVIDGTPEQASTLYAAAGNSQTIAMNALKTLSAGSHTIKLQWRVSANTANNFPSSMPNWHHRRLTVIEFASG